MAKHNPNPISYFDLVSCVCSARTPKTDRPGGWAQLPTATEPSPRPPARRRSPRRPVRRATMSREGPRIGVRVDYHRSVWLPDLTTKAVVYEVDENNFAHRITEEVVEDPLSHPVQWDQRSCTYQKWGAAAIAALAPEDRAAILGQMTPHERATRHAEVLALDEARQARERAAEEAAEPRPEGYSQAHHIYYPGSIPTVAGRLRPVPCPAWHKDGAPTRPRIAEEQRGRSGVMKVPELAIVQRTEASCSRRPTRAVPWKPRKFHTGTLWYPSKSEQKKRDEAKRAAAEAKEKAEAAEAAARSAVAAAPVFRWDITSLREELKRRHVSSGQLFSFMDADRSDRITFGEFERGIEMCGIRPTPSSMEMKMLFLSFDQDSDRSLSYREVLEALGCAPKPPSRQDSSRPSTACSTAPQGDRITTPSPMLSGSEAPALPTKPLCRR